MDDGASAGSDSSGDSGVDALDQVLRRVGPRLRALRQQRRTTLAELSAATGISVSTLSRLESGQRRPTLELLLPLARVHQVAFEDLIGAPATGDPRIHLRPVVRHGMTHIPLTRRPGGLQAYKLLIPPGVPAGEPEQQVHEGYDWVYVLSGRLRLLLGEHDLTLTAGEVAEFDTRTPHWFGNPGPRPAEVLGLFGPQGERLHVRTRPAFAIAAHAQSAAIAGSEAEADDQAFVDAISGDWAAEANGEATSGGTAAEQRE